MSGDAIQVEVNHRLLDFNLRWKLRGGASGDRPPLRDTQMPEVSPVLAVCPGSSFPEVSPRVGWQAVCSVRVVSFLCVAFTGAVKLAIGGLSLYVPGIVLTCKTRDGSFFLVVYECGSEGEGR